MKKKVTVYLATLIAFTALFYGISLIPINVNTVIAAFIIILVLLFTKDILEYCKVLFFYWHSTLYMLTHPESLNALIKSKLALKDDLTDMGWRMYGRKCYLSLDWIRSLHTIDSSTLPHHYWMRRKRLKEARHMSLLKIFFSAFFCAIGSFIPGINTKIVRQGFGLIDDLFIVTA